MTKKNDYTKPMPGPSFKIDRAGDFALIDKIVKRAWDIECIRDSYHAQIDLRMDVVACHANGNPLRLNDLLVADDFNFLHDISGICRHLNRETGALGDGFSPRFSQRQKEAA